jgi:hypothetical protein
MVKLMSVPASGEHRPTSFEGGCELTLAQHRAGLDVIPQSVPTRMTPMSSARPSARGNELGNQLQDRQVQLGSERPTVLSALG